MDPLVALLGAGCAFLALMMVAVWLLSVWRNNAGIVDVAWSASFAAVAAIYVGLADGWPPRDWVLLTVVAVWSLRLAVHLLIRVAGDHPREDSRYAELRRSWGKSANLRMLLFFEVQAVAALLLTVPFALIALDGSPGFRALEWLGVAVWAAGVAGEATADWQLARFRKRPDAKGRVCQEGLWAYSRHPNYFFEWIIWCGFALFAVSAPRGWIGLFVVPMMFYVMRYGTGVPYAEASSLASRGDAYRAYQRSTNIFFPGPRRTGEA